MFVPYSPLEPRLVVRYKSFVQYMAVCEVNSPLDSQISTTDCKPNRSREGTKGGGAHELGRNGGEGE